MKINRIYRFFFNMMLSENSRLLRYDIDDNFIALTDGYRAYRVLRRDLPLNLDKIKDITQSNLPKFELTDAHKKLERTTELKDCSIYGKHIYARKYHCGEFDCWVNESYVELFENAIFYGTGEVYPIIVCEGNRIAQGIILPIRVQS